MADRHVRVWLHAKVNRYIAEMKRAGTATRDLHNEIDKTNDRTAWMAQGILALTPAITTLGAGAVPVISGLATQMTVAATAAGTMALGFNGVGDALTALNAYQLDPTAANLEKLEHAMAKIGPEGEEFVQFLDSLGPQFAALSNVARAGMFPGITEGIESFMDLMPRFNRIVSEVSAGVGELASTAGADLAGPEWDEFFTFLEEEAKPTLIEMGNTVGNFAQGLGSMMVAFGPLSSDFSSGFEDMSESFAEWAAGLEDTQGFQEFVDYVQRAAPLALDLLGSLSMAFVELAEAAAVIGPSAIKGLTVLLDVIGDLLNTPLGPVIIGFMALTSAWGRLNAVAAITGSGVMGKAIGGFVSNVKAIGPAARGSAAGLSALAVNFATAGTASERMAAQSAKAKGSLGAFGRSAGGVAGQVGLLALTMSDVDDRMGITNTTSLTLAGSLMGPWGAAVGAGAGLLLDLKSASDQATEGFRGLDDAVEDKNIEALRANLAKAKAELEDINEIDGVGDWFSDVAADLFTGGAGEGITDVYTREIEKSEAALRELNEAQAEAAKETAYYDALQAETAALEENIAAMRAKREEALRDANAELNYAEALLDARDAAREHGKVLSKTGELMDGHRRAGIEAKRELHNLAGAWNELSDEAQNTPGAYRGAIRSFVDLATKMGMSEDAARALAREILEIPSEHRSRISLEVDTAMARAKAIKAELATIDRNVDVWVNVRKGTGYMPSGGGLGGPQVGSADGGSVPKTGLPYADRHPYLLADGEEVVSNRFGQADRWRGLLKAINSNRLADGGTVGSSPALTLSGVNIDYERLAGAMLRARPLYGNVQVVGDGSFRRALQEDKQRAALGGF